LCVPCAVAEAEYHAKHRAKMKYPRCKEGHYQTPDNTYHRTDGTTRCAECAAAQYRAKQARKQYPAAA
jgi:hypothetical protein